MKEKLENQGGVFEKDDTKGELCTNHSLAAQ